MIYKYCADRGRPLRLSDADREFLTASFDDRLQLALETVAEALVFFRDHVLCGQRWSHAGGASLTTYFIGSCLFAFPNVFRRWQAEQRKWRQALAVETLHCPEGRGRSLADQPGTDPADLIVGRAAVIAELNGMKPAERAAAALVIDGDSFTEAAARLRTTDRGIEGRLYRYRSRIGQQDRQREDRGANLARRRSSTSPRSTGSQRYSRSGTPTVRTTPEPL